MLFIIFATLSVNCVFGSSRTSHGQNFIRECADLFIVRNSKSDSVLLPAIPGFGSMIDGIMGSCRSSRELIMLGKYLDIGDSAPVSSRESYFLKLAVNGMYLSNFNLLEYRGLFESEGRQSLFSEIVGFAVRTGAPLTDISKFLDQPMEDTVALGERIDAIKSSENAYQIKSLLNHKYETIKSPSLLRLYSRAETDLEDALAWHGLSSSFVGKSFTRFLQASNLNSMEFTGQQEMVLDLMSDLMHAVASLPEGVVDMKKYMSLLYDVARNYSEIDFATTSSSSSTVARLADAISELKSFSLQSVGGEFTLLKAELLNRIESSITEPEAKIFLKADLDTFTERFIVNLARTRGDIAPEEQARHVEVMRTIIDFSIRVINDPEKKYSRVALGEWIRSNRVRIPNAITLYEDSRELNVGILQLALRIAKDFGFHILTEYPALIPGWSQRKKMAISHLFGAYIFFGAKDDDEIPFSFVRLSKTNDEIRLEKTISVLGSMVRKGITGLQLAPLIDPMTWAMEFINKPSSRFASWVATRFPSSTFIANLPIALPELRRYIDEFCGFPSKYIALAKKSAQLHANVQWSRVMLKTTWALELPKKVMRAEVETQNFALYDFAYSYLDLVPLILSSSNPHEHQSLSNRFVHTFNRFYSAVTRGLPAVELIGQLAQVFAEMKVQIAAMTAVSESGI